MKELNFEPLKANQIEVRPTDTKYKGKCTLLLYIDSRSAADILNETVGPMNWQIEYKDVAGQIYGRLSIWDDERNMWVYKEDTGEESNIAEKKGQSSDIVKRCLARWGCDYLYHTPRVKINCPENYYYNDRMTMSFNVKDIMFVGKECVKLVIADMFGNVVFDWNSNQGNTIQYQQQHSQQYKEPVATVGENDMIPKWLFGKAANAETMETLKQIWDENINYRQNKNFKNVVKKRKQELLAAAS